MTSGNGHKERVLRYLRYLKYRIGYESLPMFLLDVLGKLGVYIQPFVVIQEGLKAGMDEEFADRFTNFQFRYLDKEDMTRIASLVERRVSLEQLISHLDQGRRCLACLEGDDLVAFSWFNLDTGPHPAYRYRIGEDEAYLFDAFTLPNYRGRGIAPYVRYRLYLELEKLGYTRLYSVSETYNKPAIRLKMKLRAKIVQRGVRVYLFKRWGRSFLFKKRC